MAFRICTRIGRSQCAHSVNSKRILLCALFYELSQIKESLKNFEYSNLPEVKEISASEGKEKIVQPSSVYTRDP